MSERAKQSTEQPSENGKAGIAGLVQKIIAWALQLRVVRAVLLYTDHRGPLLADSITYRALFSVFAAVLLGFSIAALWLAGDPAAMRTLVETLDRVVPGITDVVDPESVEAPTEFSIVGAISLIGLIGAAIGAIGSLRTALRILADEVHDDGFFLWVLLRNLLVGLALGGLLVAAAVLSVVGSVGISTVASWLGHSGGVGTRIFGLAVVFVIDTLAVAVLFKVLSGVRAPVRGFWAGAALGGVGLTVLQELSGLFVRGATQNPLLATFAALISLLLWFNLSSQVILVASCYIITASAEAKDRVRAKYGASTLAQYRRRRAEDRLRVAARELRAAEAAEAREAGRDPEPGGEPASAQPAISNDGERGPGA
ncbi:MAG: YihY/virulence factor BrkB family protein [Leucobacter sp.]